MLRRTVKVTAGSAIAALACSAFSIAPANAAITNPDNLGDTPQYVVSKDSNLAAIEQLLTTGDTNSADLAWQGIPDGMGAVHNADGTVTFYVNHELSASDYFVQRQDQSYGGFGANISKVTLGTNGKVSNFTNAISSVAWYDYQAGNWNATSPTAPDYAPETDSYSTPLHGTDLNRFCSATLIVSGDLKKVIAETSLQYVTRVVKIKGKKVTQYQNSAGKWATKKVKRPVTKNVTYGYASPVFLTGEEGGDESRMFGLNTATGELVQLPAFGLGATENIIVAPSTATGKETIALTGEDGAATDSQLFMYHGTKTTSGTWANKAGLTNGLRYVARATVQNNTVSSNIVTPTTRGMLANDVNIRSSLRRYSISDVKAGADNTKVAATSVSIADGEVTVTVAAGEQRFVPSDVITVSGFTSDTALLNGEQTVTATTSTTFKFRIDDDTINSSTGSSEYVLAAADRVYLKTGATAHGLSEGDKITLRGNSDSALNGQFTVESTPLDTVFTITAPSASALSGAPTAAAGQTVVVNKLVDIEFRKVPTVSNRGEGLSGEAQQVVAANRGTEFARIEDMSFDPTNPNVVYFITTQSDSDGAATDLQVPGSTDLVRDATSKRDGGALWKLTFEDVADPSLGATLDIVLNGSETPVIAGTADSDSGYANGDLGGALYKPDNLAISADGQYAFIQEDPGAVDRVTRLLAVRMSDAKLVTVAAFDTDMFSPTANSSSYLTNDEETSGIIDITSQLSATDPTFLFNAQIHPLAKAGGVSYSDSTSGASQPLQSRSAAILRPDLNPRSAVNVDVAKVADGFTNGVKVTSTLLSIYITNAVNADSDGFVAGSLEFGAGDTITVTGINPQVNGTYVVKTIDPSTNLLTITTAGITNTSVGDTPASYITDPVTDLSFKTANSEGGALYKMTLTGGWAALFE